MFLTSIAPQQFQFFDLVQSSRPEGLAERLVERL
jgi:hypothetical protein